MSLLELGDTLFDLAYRSCDTIERGRDMLEQAMDCYLRIPIQANSAAASENDDNDDDDDDDRREATVNVPLSLRVLERQALLLMVLGYENDAERVVREALVEKQESLESVAEQNDESPRVDLSEPTHFSFRHLLFWIKVRQLIEARNEHPDSSNNDRGSNDYHNSNSGEKHQEALDETGKMALPTEIEQLWQEMNTELPEFGMRIMEAIPLSPDIAPGLFCDEYAPVEFWQLLQDMIFFSPSIRDFVEDELMIVDTDPGR